MVTAFLVMGGLGLLASVGLGIAAKVFFVKEDPRLVELEGAMPGTNCGGCGYAGCADAAVLKGEAEANVCVADGEDVAINVAGIMGLELALGEKQVAELICHGGLRAEEVTIVYRRSRKEMPAAAYEVDAAEEEGVKFHFLAAPARFIGDENGRLKQMEFIRMELGEPDSSGRRRPVPIEGSETLLDIDNVIAAIGQRPDVTFVQEGKRTGELKLTRWNTIDADEGTLVTDLPYVLTGGDLFTGAATVVEAIGAGRLAARSIHLNYKDEEVLGVTDAQRKRLPESVLPSIEGVGHSERAEMPEIPVAEREHNEIEVELGLSEEETRTEAKRCLRCGLTCYNREKVVGREAA